MSVYKRPMVGKPRVWSMGAKDRHMRRKATRYAFGDRSCGSRLTIETGSDFPIGIISGNSRWNEQANPDANCGGRAA